MIGTSTHPSEWVLARKKPITQSHSESITVAPHYRTRVYYVVNWTQCLVIGPLCAYVCVCLHVW